MKRRSAPKKGIIIKLAALLVLIAVFVGTTSFLTFRSILKLLHPLQYDDLVTQYAAEFELEATLVLAVIKTESSFDSQAESSAGAQGLMQITPDTFDWLQTKRRETRDAAEIFEPETSICYGSFFLRLLLDEFEDERTALAAYHAGRGQVNRWLKESANSADGKTLTHIPSAETAHYVSKVITAKNRYENLYKERNRTHGQ